MTENFRYQGQGSSAERKSMFILYSKEIVYTDIVSKISFLEAHRYKNTVQCKFINMLEQITHL
jgi:hypothetical protein